MQGRILRYLYEHLKKNSKMKFELFEKTRIIECINLNKRNTQKNV